MELKHNLDLKIDSREGLIALGLILLAVVLLGFAGLIVTRGPGKGQGGDARPPEVTLSVRSGHGPDDAQQGGIKRAGAALDRRP